MRFTSFVASMVALAAHADGTIEGTVVLKVKGAPASPRNAFVYVDGFKTKPPHERVRVAQSGRTFTPAVAGVVVGQQVEFVNDEPLEDIYHHVFTPSKLFNSKLFKPHEKPFDTPDLTRQGRIDVFCDIHKNMYATLWVVPNSAFALVGDDGKFKIEHVPAGNWKLVAWHRSSEQQVEVPVTVADGKVATVAVTIEGQSQFEDFLARHKHADGKEYVQKPDGGYAGELDGKAW